MTTGEQDEWKAVLVGAMSYYTKGSEHLGLADMAEHVRRLERENRQMRDKAALADVYGKAGCVRTNQWTCELCHRADIDDCLSARYDALAPKETTT